MIKPDLASGAAMLTETIGIAEGIGLLHECLPEAVVWFSVGLAILLRDLQLHVVEQELAKF